MNALSRSLAVLVLVASCFGLSSCYTQLAAADSPRGTTDGYRIPADRTAQSAPAAQNEAAPPAWNGAARVGLGHGVDYAEDDYVEGEYAEEGYRDDYRYEDGYGQDDGYYTEGTYGSSYDDVQVTRYRYEDEYYE